MNHNILCRTKSCVHIMTFYLITRNISRHSIRYFEALLSVLNPCVAIQVNLCIETYNIKSTCLNCNWMVGSWWFKHYCYSSFSKNFIQQTWITWEKDFSHHLFLSLQLSLSSPLILCVCVPFTLIHTMKYILHRQHTYWNQTIKKQCLILCMP